MTHSNTENAEPTDPMSTVQVAYTRSGGIAGLVQSLSIDGRSLSAHDRRLGDLPTRELSDEEQSELAELLEAIHDAGETPSRKGPSAPHISDAFQIALSIDGATVFETRSPMLPPTGAGAWDPLLAWLDGKLRRAVEGGSASRYRIESVE